MCTAPARSTHQSTDWHTWTFCWRRSTDRSTEGKGRSTGPVDRQATLLLLMGFGLRFWKRVESNCDFLKSWDSLAINKGVKLPWIVSLEKLVLDHWINKISLSPLSERHRQNLVKYCVCFLSCLFCSCLWVLLWCISLSWLEFLIGCCQDVCNRWYQSIPGSSWDRVSILRALVAV